MSSKHLKRRRHKSRRDVIAAEATAPMISFIIPALNEERLIANTLRQFSCLDGAVSYEVIVADGASQDRTVEIAQQLGARAVIDRGKRKTIASGRNLGARSARGSLLVFCDADTQFENIGAFVTRILDVFRDSSLVGAVPWMSVPPGERIWSDRVFSTFLNTLFRVSFRLNHPFCCGVCQVVRSTSFREVNGYDRQQVHGEDSALFQQLARIGKIRFLSDQMIYESPRRYRKFGYFRLIKTALFSILGQKILKRNVLKSWERVD